MNRVFFKQTELQTSLKKWISHVRVFETIDSTNQWLKHHQSTLDSHTLVLAHHQSQGRGRMERIFHSAQGKGIYLSLLLKNEAICPFMALCVPVALTQTLHSYLNIQASIKWPNDIYIQDRKVVGILIEKQSSPQQSDDVMIVGVGINVFQQNFPSDITDKATSLDLFTKATIDPSIFIQTFIDYLYQYMQDRDLVFKLYRSHLYKRNQVVRIIQGETNYLAEIVDINQDGYLLVKTQKGLIRTLISTDLQIEPQVNE